MVEFLVGKADNPKVNAILLVKGSRDKTHESNFKQFRQFLSDLMEEQRREREKAE